MDTVPSSTPEIKNHHQEVGMGRVWTEREASFVGSLKQSKCRECSQHVESSKQSTWTRLGDDLASKTGLLGGSNC